MNNYLAQVSAAARSAVSRRDLATLAACTQEILKHDSSSPEGYFLLGLVEKSSKRPEKACEAFSKALELDSGRYDAAIELAHQHSTARRNAAAAALVSTYEAKLTNSPLYLNMAGSVYTEIGMPDKAWPLFTKANELQPGVDLFQADLANCSVFLGKIDEAKQIFKRLLDRFPTHQRNHLSLARLEKATDKSHIQQMKSVLRSTNLSPDKNVFLYYAIGKELEDLEEWEEAFEYFKMAGDAVTSVANYDIDFDLALIDKVIDICNADWLRDCALETPADPTTKTPIFVVGLPRTGTTLTDRIIASHSQVQSAGETQFMQMVLRRESGVVSEEKMTPEMIEVTAKQDMKIIADGYMDMLSYRLGEEPIFVDKLPFNILYLGFIAKAFPGARIVVMKRNPMDSCFAMYKQVFTWAYKFSYSLEGLGRFYVAYDRLLDHWQKMLGDRLIEVEYEGLVADQENQTRILLDKLDLDFEEACLNFDKNKSATATASSVQVREKVHTRSVNRWKNYQQQLQPLRDYLENAGIAVD
jgi:tetratricopeptide (TPR) repeat protein